MPTQFETMELDDEEEEEPPPKKGILQKPPDKVRKFLRDYLESLKATKQAAAEAEGKSTPEVDGQNADKTSPGSSASADMAENGATANGEHREDVNGTSTEGDVQKPAPPAAKAGDSESRVNGDGPAADATVEERSTSPSTTRTLRGRSTSASEKPQAEDSPQPVGDLKKKAAKPKKPYRVKILKLKDWPSEGDFESNYPDLYHDFSNALPVPDYTRRNGVMNLYSHVGTGRSSPLTSVPGRCYSPRHWPQDVQRLCSPRGPRRHGLDATPYGCC